MNKLIAISGSTRNESFNKKILKYAIVGAREAGAIVTTIDLKDYNLPLYDEDYENSEGIPPNAILLKEIFKSHHGLLLALPEYNSSMSAVFKNMIDWVSRKAINEENLASLIGKTVALMSASPGHFGGARGLTHARAMFSNIHMIVLPEQISLPYAHSAFDEYDNLKNHNIKNSLEKLGADLVDLTLRVRGFHPHIA